MNEKIEKKILLRILCLEDEPKDAELIRELLVEAGYDLQMDLVKNEKGFLSYLQNNEYDVILADYKLPGFDAPSALRIVQEKCPDVPFICVSGTMGEDVAVELLKQGATDYVLKDRMGRLTSAVQRAVDEASEQNARRQAEESLCKSEEKFRSLVESAFDAIYLMRGRHYEYVNPRFTELTGYTFKELTSTDFDFDQLLTDKSRQIVDKRYQDRVEGIEIPNEYEIQIKSKDGRILDVEVSTVSLGSKDNVVVLGMIHNITRRKEAEKALLKAHRLLNETQQISKIGGWDYDVTTKIATWTDEVYNIYGVGKDFNPNNIISDLSFFTPDSIPVIKKAFRDAVEKGLPYDLELEFIKANGERIWIRTMGNPHIENGKVVRVTGSIMDISERKRSEIMVEHLNRVLRAIRDINQLIVHEKDPEKIIRKTSDILVERRGYREVMIILTDESGRPYIWADTGSAAAFVPIENNLRQGILPPCCDEKLFQEEINIISDRSKVCASCPIVADVIQYKAMNARICHNKKLYGYMSVSIDAELPIDAEEKALFAELASDVAFGLYNIEQVNAKEQIENERDRIEAELRQSQKMEAVGQLAGGVAHDFNNMLSIIMSYADLALAQMKPGEPFYKNFLEIHTASQRSANIIRQLLAFSRKQIIAPEAVKLNELIHDLLKMLGRLIGEDIELKFIPADDLWFIWIDPSQINQILTNLAVNSRDAIADVGSVTIETANVILDESYRKIHKYVVPGEYVMLMFSDTGAGIKAETLERIFEPFFTTKEDGKGTGLGLSTVYGIVKQNNGYINVYSEPGVGTTFKIYLPRYIGTAEAPSQKVKTAILTGTETVLIVEDYAEILELATGILEQYGYKVLKARTPDEAIHICEQYQENIHLLITDVVMPTMNGRDLEERIKKVRPNILTLFMSGYTADIIAQRGVVEQGVAFLQKPFSVQSLVMKVRETLDA